MVCCDTCPFTPTCEEEQDFLADIGLAPVWGEEYEEDSCDLCPTPCACPKWEH